MKLSASFLSIKEDIKNNLKRLNDCDIDYLHLDVMDGIFVDNKTYNANEAKDLLVLTDKPKDVHLMVSDVKKYIDDFAVLNPEFLTFHFEAVSEISGVIKYIRSKNIKVGISINPETLISEIIDYLPFVDLVLVMSVAPGHGGQKFIESSIDKVNFLYEYREKNNLDYLIEVDGGINDETIKLVGNADICVVGSYIALNNYEDAVYKLKN